MRSDRRKKHRSQHLKGTSQKIQRTSLYNSLRTEPAICQNNGQGPKTAKQQRGLGPNICINTVYIKVLRDAWNDAAPLFRADVDQCPNVKHTFRKAHFLGQKRRWRGPLMSAHISNLTDYSLSRQKLRSCWLFFNAKKQNLESAEQAVCLSAQTLWTKVLRQMRLGEHVGV